MPESDEDRCMAEVKDYRASGVVRWNVLKGLKITSETLVRISACDPGATGLALPSDADANASGCWRVPGAVNGQCEASDPLFKGRPRPQ